MRRGAVGGGKWKGNRRPSQFISNGLGGKKSASSLHSEQSSCCKMHSVFGEGTHLTSPAEENKMLFSGGSISKIPK